MLDQFIRPQANAFGIVGDQDHGTFNLHGFNSYSYRARISAICPGLIFPYRSSSINTTGPTLQSPKQEVVTRVHFLSGVVSPFFKFSVSRSVFQMAFPPTTWQGAFSQNLMT